MVIQPGWGKKKKPGDQSPADKPLYPPVARGPVPTYDATVNKGSINMRVFISTLNSRAQEGWKLDHVFEQHGNTIMVWRKDPK